MNYSSLFYIVIVTVVRTHRNTYLVVYGLRSQRFFLGESLPIITIRNYTVWVAEIVGSHRKEIAKRKGRKD